MKFFLLSITALIFASSCSEEKKPVTNAADYESYLMINRQVSNYSIDDDLAFWEERANRMPADDASKIKIAGLQAAQFRKTGNVEDLKKSDSIYHKLLITTQGKAGLYLALAQNSITQHQFKQAGKYAEAALNEGGKRAASMLVIADVALELGDIARAKYVLNQFSNKNSFAHLIRQVKVKDQEGQLDSAIFIMEKALDRIKGNEELYCWALSNLGDMYGHAGRIEAAYQAYLTVLQKDATYDYALKGIAWIVLSNDKNYAEAKRIINVLASRSRMPESHLMLAEIAAMENDEQEKTNQLKAFVTLTNNVGYKTMYAKYLAGVYADDLNDPDASLAIAAEEINNRPTPQSYDLKAWALLKSGNEKEALAIVQKYVQNKTFEPDATYHLGMIYLVNGYDEQAEKYLEEARQSSFELGPAITREVNAALDKI